jgi:hypothetical protein
MSLYIKYYWGTTGIVKNFWFIAATILKGLLDMKIMFSAFLFFNSRWMFSMERVVSGNFM